MIDYRVSLDGLLQSNISELFYQCLGSTPLTDRLYMFVISPLAFVAFVMNMVSFVVITRSDELKCNLIYKYLVLYAFNNSRLCLLISMSFCTLALRYFPWSFSLFSRVHRCYIMNFVVISFVLVNKALEILIICHRLSPFKTMFNKVNKAFSPLSYAILFVACCLLNLPFIHMIKSDSQLDTDLADFTGTEQITYCAKTLMYNSLVGNIIESTASLC